jgi:hypothetical protein
MPAGRRKRTGGDAITRHPSPPISTARQVSSAKVKINLTGMLGDADMHRSLRAIKLCPRLKQIEHRPDRLGAQRCAGLLIVAPPQSGPEPFAANGPGLPVTVDQEIGKCGAGGGVKQLASDREVDEHTEGALRPKAVHGSIRIAAGAVWSGIRPSLRRVRFQSCRATLRGSTLVAFHHSRSSAARWTAR